MGSASAPSGAQGAEGASVSPEGAVRQTVYIKINSEEERVCSENDNDLVLVCSGCGGVGGLQLGAAAAASSAGTVRSALDLINASAPEHRWTQYRSTRTDAQSTTIVKVLFSLQGCLAIPTFIIGPEAGNLSDR